MNQKEALLAYQTGASHLKEEDCFFYKDREFVIQQKYQWKWMYMYNIEFQVA